MFLRRRKLSGSQQRIQSFPVLSLPAGPILSTSFPGSDRLIQWIFGRPSAKCLTLGISLVRPSVALLVKVTVLLASGGRAPGTLVAAVCAVFPFLSQSDKGQDVIQLATGAPAAAPMLAFAPWAQMPVH